MDAYSDLDLVIVVEPDHFEAVMAERQDIAERLGHLLSCFTGEHVNEPRLLICLYDTPLLHVDLKFVSLPDLAQRVEDPVILFERDGQVSQVLRATGACFPLPDPQALEDRFWIWAHYGATKIGRGEWFDTLNMLAYLREKVIGPLLHRKYGELPRGTRRLETVAPAEVPLLTQTLGAHNRADTLAALQATITLYRQLRASYIDRGEVIARTDAEAAVTDYVTRLGILPKEPEHS